MNPNFERIFYTLKFEVQLSMLLRDGGIVGIAESKGMKAMLFNLFDTYVEAFIDPNTYEILIIQRPNVESFQKYLEKIALGSKDYVGSSI